MVKKLSSWNLFVKKVFQEGKAKNKDFKFKDALKEASARKGEMKNMKTSDKSEKEEPQSRKRGTKKRGKSHKRKTRKNRK
uniref:Uncharacterized protein n=1 Tax=viral metagenome TaxID=1070528 RepID=A0A6C0LJK1_9ZZZZ